MDKEVRYGQKFTKIKCAYFDFTGIMISYRTHGDRVNIASKNPFITPNTSIVVIHSNRNSRHKKTKVNAHMTIDADDATFVNVDNQICVQPL